jgi:hypothetical protein
MVDGSFSELFSFLFDNACAKRKIATFCLHILKFWKALGLEIRWRKLMR